MPNVEFAGETFTVSDRIGLMPLMRFAKVAKSGVDSADMDGLAAMYDLLQQCFPDQEWQRFEAAADRTHADGDELMGIVGKVFEVLSERPTSRPSDSSDGPSSTEQSSAGGFSLPVRLDGRPDLQMIALNVQESRTA